MPRRLPGSPPSGGCGWPKWQKWLHVDGPISVSAASTGEFQICHSEKFAISLAQKELGSYLSFTMPPAETATAAVSPFYILPSAFPPTAPRPDSPAPTAALSAFFILLFSSPLPRPRNHRRFRIPLRISHLDGSALRIPQNATTDDTDSGGSERLFIRVHPCHPWSKPRLPSSCRFSCPFLGL